MGNKRDWETKTILIKLSIFAPSFYIIYYLMSIILIGSYKVSWSDLGRYPFRISESEFSPGENDAATGAWLAMVLTYTLSLSLTFWVVHATRRAWDYVATVSITHWLLCCIVEQAFPTHWVWWVTLVVAALGLSLVSEVVNYYLIDLREIDLDTKR